MVKALTVVKISIFKQLFALLLLASLLFPTAALAAPYGSGSYGDCEYEDGCPVVTTGGATTSGSTGATSEDDAGSSIVLNTFEEFFSATGTDVAGLKVGDVVGFCIGKTTVFQACDSTKDSYHTATLKSINLAAGTVVITIASTPTDYTLTLDTPMKIDVDKDETDDVELTLTSLTATTADINFRSLATSTPTVTTDTKEDTPKVEESSDLSWLWWLFGAVGLLALLWVIIVFFKKRRGDDDKGAGYGTGPMGSSNSGGSSSSNASSSASVTSFAPNTFTPTEVAQNTFSNLTSVNTDITPPSTH